MIDARQWQELVRKTEVVARVLEALAAAVAATYLAHQAARGDDQHGK